MEERPSTGGRGPFILLPQPSCLLLIVFVLDSSSLCPLPTGWNAALPPCTPASGAEPHGQMLIGTCIGGSLLLVIPGGKGCRGGVLGGQRRTMAC